jgi:hypothetical protein
MRPKAIFGPSRAPRSIRSICAQVLPRPHQPVVDYSNDAVRRDYSSPAARALPRPRRALRLLVSGRTRSTSTLLYAAGTRLPAAAALHQLHRAPGCLGPSRGSSRGSLRRSSSTTPGSSSTTSPPPRVRVPRHVARLIMRIVASLVVDYSASRRLVVDYFDSTARPGASARRAARRAARCATRRRLLRLRRASGCLGMSRGPSHGSSSTTPCVATSSCGHAGSTSTTPCLVTTCLAATLALLRVCRAPPRRHLLVASRRPFISTSFPN